MYHHVSPGQDKTRWMKERTFHLVLQEAKPHSVGKFTWRKIAGPRRRRGGRSRGFERPSRRVFRAGITDLRGEVGTQSEVGLERGKPSFRGEEGGIRRPAQDHEPPQWHGHPLRCGRWPCLVSTWASAIYGGRGHPRHQGQSEENPRHSAPISTSISCDPT